MSQQQPPPGWGQQPPPQGQPPAGASGPGSPQQPPYGSPAQGQPPYGAPPQGQPSPQQPPYGYPSPPPGSAYPAPPPGSSYGAPPPGWAPQQPAGGPTAPSRGNGGFVALLVGLSVAFLLLLAGGIWFVASIPTVAALEAGDCLSSSDIAAGEDDVDSFRRADCDGDHDAEVLGVMTAGGTGAVQALCAAKVTDAETLAGRGIEVRGLTPEDDLAPGDRVVCLARNADGSPLTARVR